MAILCYMSLVSMATVLYESCIHGYCVIRVLYPWLLCYMSLVSMATVLYESCIHGYCVIQVVYPSPTKYSIADELLKVPNEPFQ